MGEWIDTPVSFWAGTVERMVGADTSRTAHPCPLAVYADALLVTVKSKVIESPMTVAVPFSVICSVCVERIIMKPSIVFPLTVPLNVPGDEPAELIVPVQLFPDCVSCIVTAYVPPGTIVYDPAQYPVTSVPEGDVVSLDFLHDDIVHAIPITKTIKRHEMKILLEAIRFSVNVYF
jgi:hypothetical protein